MTNFNLPPRSDDELNDIYDSDIFQASGRVPGQLSSGYENLGLGDAHEMTAADWDFLPEEDLSRYDDAEEGEPDWDEDDWDAYVEES